MKIENSGIVSRQSVGGVPRVAPSIEEEHRHQEHFKTDHLLTNLKGHTISSGAVTVSAQGAKFLLNMASTMILARLLMPRDFGLVAMVMTVTNFLRVFKDAGLSIATVQRERIVPLRFKAAASDSAVFKPCIPAEISIRPFYTASPKTGQSQLIGANAEFR